MRCRICKRGYRATGEFGVLVMPDGKLKAAGFLAQPCPDCRGRIILNGPEPAAEDLRDESVWAAWMDVGGEGGGA